MNAKKAKRIRAYSDTSSRALVFGSQLAGMPASVRNKFTLVNHPDSGRGMYRAAKRLSA